MTHKSPPRLIPVPDARIGAFRHWCPIDHPEPFVCSLDVTDDDLSSTIPHVSNIEYVRWLDRAAELHADSLGYTRSALLDDNRMWFVARHEVDYLAETWLDDKLLVATWVRSFSRAKTWRETVVLRPADETVVCRAATLWVLVDLGSRRPCRFDAELVRKFQPLQNLISQEC